MRALSFFKAFLMFPVILEKFSLIEYFDNIWYQLTIERQGANTYNISI